MQLRKKEASISKNKLSLRPSLKSLPSKMRAPSKSKKQNPRVPPMKLKLMLAGLRLNMMLVLPKLMLKGVIRLLKLPKPMAKIELIKLK